MTGTIMNMFDSMQITYLSLSTENRTFKDLENI